MAKVQMPSVSFIVARSRETHVIGCENQLPWRLRSDLGRFRKLTTGHAVIMGRKTFESIGKRLPNRLNIVLSKRANPESDLSESSVNSEGLAFVKQAEDALLLADKYSYFHSASNIFVIGGEEIYNLFNNLVNTVYLTEVRASVIGDAYFRNDFDNILWKKVESIIFDQSEIDQFGSEFLRYERIKKIFRYREQKKLSALRASFSKNFETREFETRFNSHEITFAKTRQSKIEFN